MRQLQFNECYDKIVEEKLAFWKCREDIPTHIKDFIYAHCDKNVLYDGNYFCPLCVKELNEDGYCKNCLKKYDVKENNYIKEVNISDIKSNYFDRKYYVFDVIDYEVLLYVIYIRISYEHPYTSYPFRQIFFHIENVFHILKDKMVDLIGNREFAYENIDKKMNEELDFVQDNYNIDFYLGNFYCDEMYLYVDNLNDLKDTIYRYTYIWEAKEYLKDKSLYVANLTYIPIHYPCFEYLIKTNFFSLAFDMPHLLKYDNYAQKLLNPKNDYLEFMIKNNFDCYMFEALKLIKIKDMDLISFIDKDLSFYEEILKIRKMDILKLCKYLMKNNYNVIDYFDYLSVANELGYNLKDKNVLFPQNFGEEHNKVIENKQRLFEKKVNKKIKKLAKSLEKYKYEDSEYVIYPAKSVNDLIKEGQNQNNCLRLYIDDYSNNKLQIYFMREKKNINKSFVTIEVRYKRIMQARLKNNEIPNSEIMKILEKWENTLKNVGKVYQINEQK